jgi:hypothetical protein
MPGKNRAPGLVAETIRPQVRSRGPRNAPIRIAWRASTTVLPCEPTSRIVVTPRRSASRSQAATTCAAVPGSSGSAPASGARSFARTCACTSTRPGISVRPSRSIATASSAGPAAATRPSRTSTVAPSRGGAPVPSSRRAFVSSSG